MLNKAFVPDVLPISWKGSLPVRTDGTAVTIPIR
jgi:hypothetical protein